MSLQKYHLLIDPGGFVLPQSMYDCVFACGDADSKRFSDKIM